MTELRQAPKTDVQRHEFRRDLDELFRNFSGSMANRGGHPRRVDREATDSRVDPLTDNVSDETRRIDTRRQLNWGESAATVDYLLPATSSKQALRASGVLFTVGRIVIVLTFIMSALFRLTDLDGSATKIASILLPLPEPLADAATGIEAILGMPFATAVVFAGAALEILAGVLVAMSILICPASIVLLIFTAIGIYWFQWDFQNGVRFDQIIQALNELSMVGALLILASLRKARDRDRRA